jgi:pheromone shutdown protein TraB
MTQESPGTAPPASSGTMASKRHHSSTGKKVGYGIAIAVNGLMLFVANNLLEWDWLPWLTEAWNDVLPLVSFSLIASMVINLVYMAFDVDWFKSLTQAILAGISLFVTVRVFQVFPFDFTAYESGWETLTRAILIFMMIGITIGMVVETVKFIRAVVRHTSSTAPTG